MISSKQMKKDIYLSEFINSEIARLEEISVGKMSGTFAMRRRVSSNMEKFKLFVDEIDQIVIPQSKKKICLLNTMARYPSTEH